MCLTVLPAEMYILDYDELRGDCLSLIDCVNENTQGHCVLSRII